VLGKGSGVPGRRASCHPSPEKDDRTVIRSNKPGWRAYPLPCPAMDYGLALPNIGDHANREGIAAAAELAERHGLTGRRATDHPLVNPATAGA